MMHEHHSKIREERLENVGKKFSTFTVIDFSGPIGKSHRYTVKCDCGDLINITCVSFERALWRKKSPCSQCNNLENLFDKREKLIKNISELNKSMDKLNKELDNLEYAIIDIKGPRTISALRKLAATRCLD